MRAKQRVGRIQLESMDLGSYFGCMVRKDVSEAVTFVSFSMLRGLLKGSLRCIFMIKID